MDDFPSMKARRLLGMEIKPREVRKVLVKQVGLAESDALDLL